MKAILLARVLSPGSGRRFPDSGYVLHHHEIDVARLGRVEHVGFEEAAEVEGLQIDRDQVGPLAFFEGPNLIVHPEGPSAPEGSQPEDATRIDGQLVLARAGFGEGQQAHRGKEVRGTGERVAVYAQREPVH